MDKSALLLSMFKRLFGPQELVCGAGSSRRLQVVDASRTAVVYASSQVRNGALDRVRLSLEKGGGEIAALELESGEPSITTVVELADRIRAFDADHIVALGGGSVVDAVKIAWLLCEHAPPEPHDVATWDLAANRERIRLTAMPTTAGSGSEASQAAVLKIPGSSGITPLVSTNWIPDLVVLDPTFHTTMPESITAQTGMDALTHAIESGTSRRAGLLHHVLAGTAVSLLIKHLPFAFAEPEDLVARENVVLAAYLSGLCQSMTSTGLAHALTHSAQSCAGIAHGLGTALFLLPAMQYNSSRDADVYENIAERTGMASSDELIGRVDQLVDKLGLPRRLSELDSKPFDKMKHGDLAQRALEDICLRTNPVPAAKEDIESILESMA